MNGMGLAAMSCLAIVAAQIPKMFQRRLGEAGSRD